jgi:putative flippase GtrA
MEKARLETVRFSRYTAVGLTTFAIDLAILWVLTDFFLVNYLLSAAIGFFIAVTINYFYCRRWVFVGTAREFYKGYGYFIQFATVGVIITVGMMWLLTAVFAWHFMLVRISVALFVGISNYLANLFLNFKVFGQEIRPQIPEQE